MFVDTQEARDIPCNRSELLLRIYKRYFTLSGMIRARLFSSFTLTDAHIDEMAESFYRCTACRRCKNACPMGIDHGLVTHLGRWILSEMGITPKALVVAVREQLEGATGNTSAIWAGGIAADTTTMTITDNWRMRAGAMTRTGTTVSSTTASAVWTRSSQTTAEESRPVRSTGTTATRS